MNKKNKQKCTNCNSGIDNEQLVCTHCGYRIKRSIIHRLLRLNIIAQSMIFFITLSTVIIFFILKNFFFIFIYKYFFIIFGYIYFALCLMILFLQKRFLRTKVYYSYIIIFLFLIATIYIGRDLSPKISYQGELYNIETSRFDEIVLFSRSNKQCNNEINHYIVNDIQIDIFCGDLSDYIFAIYDSSGNENYFNYSYILSIEELLEDDALFTVVSESISSFYVFFEDDVLIIRKNDGKLISRFLYSLNELDIKEEMTINELLNSDLDIPISVRNDLLETMDYLYEGIISDQGIIELLYKDSMKVFPLIPNDVIINIDSLQEYGYIE